MLNASIKHGISELSVFLDDSTLLALATTITQGLLKNKLTTREEALNAILNYSPDGLSFLRRKTITREVLLAYLHKKNVPLNLPASKNELIEKTAHFWQIHYTDELAASSDNAADDATIKQLAEEFTKWFYSMLNGEQCLNPEHFYPDAKLQVNSINNGQCETEVVEGDPAAIVQKLFLLKINLKLFFNPNVAGGGLQAKVDPHGLVLVLVCGTLHVRDSCVGVFEQMFGLVRDPNVHNNWKIKMTELSLRSQSGLRALH